MAAMKSYTIGELFTGSEIDRAMQLYKKRTTQREFIDEVTRSIVEPALERINLRTGQKNDARYLAYALEYAIIKSMQ